MTTWTTRSTLALEMLPLLQRRLLTKAEQEQLAQPLTLPPGLGWRKVEDRAVRVARVVFAPDLVAAPLPQSGEEMPTKTPG